MAATGTFSLSLLLKDEFGIKATAPVYVKADTTNTLDEIALYAVDYAQTADLVTGAVIDGVEVRLIVNPSGLKTTPVSGDRVEQTGLFNLKADTEPNRRDGYDLPAIRDSVLAGDRIDLSNSAVAALVTFLHTAAGLIIPVTPWGIVLSVLADAVLTFRKHRKQLTRSSFEPGP
jgi:hypothetical protein